MQETYSNKHPDENKIDLRELFHVLFQGKWFIVSLTAFASIIEVIYSLSLPNIYTSKALLVTVNTSSGMSGNLRNYSGLAGLAGINLSSGGNESNSEKAIQKISSLSFFENNILENIFLPDLMAVKSWNPETNSLEYDESLYIMKSNTWVGDYYKGKQIPSTQESFKVFISQHLSLSDNKNTDFITLSIKHKSPFIAKQWAELVVDQINTFYRQKDKSESEKAVNYLNQQISITGLSEIKQVIAQLLQEETKKLTLIEANQYYVFDYIDPPAAMELKSEPTRSLICILSALFGVLLGIIIVLIRRYAFKEIDF